MGFIPNMYANMANAPAVLSTYFIAVATGVKVLSNFSNHAFATELDEKFAAYKVA